MKSFLKKLYLFLPFKKEVFSFIKLFASPGETLYQHLYFKGLFNLKVTQDKSIRLMHYGYLVENTLFWKGIEGCWEKQSVKLWMKLCESAHVIMDIGANTGVYALLAKTISPKAEVHAFEPMPKIFEKLVNNVKANNYNIICVSKALSNFDGTAKVFPASEDHVYSVTVNKNTSSANVKVFETEIPVQKLSTYIKQNAITSIDLMKIDVETHEPEMLGGMEEFLRMWKPTMLIEILSDEIGERVEELIKDLGYLYFNIDEDGGIKQVQRIGKSDYYNYLLCSAEKAAYLKLV